MHRDPALTILVPTGRASYGSLVGLPDEHLFLRTMKSLAAQDCMDFELVIADACAAHRDLRHEICALGAPWPFPWRVVPVTSPWLSIGRAAIQRTLNIGFVYSDAKVVHMAGDAAEFPSHVVGEILKWTAKGYQPQLLSVYKRAGELIYINEQTKDERFGHGHNTSLTYGDMQKLGIFKDIARDSRWTDVERVDPLFGAPWSWLHNHPTVFRKHLFEINGFDENLDGEKALQDVEMGSRLEMAGLWKPVLTKELYCWDYDHGSWDTKTFFKESVPGPRSNYQLIVLTREQKRFRANSIKLTAKEYSWIIQSGATAIEDRCPVYDKEKEPESYFLQRIGFAIQPIFDLQSMWAARRVSEGKPCAF